MLVSPVCLYCNGRTADTTADEQDMLPDHNLAPAANVMFPKYLMEMGLLITGK